MAIGEANHSYMPKEHAARPSEKARVITQKQNL